MSRITDVDATFNQIINQFGRLLPLLSKKDPAVKHIRVLLNEALKAYAIKQCHLIETANSLIDTLYPSYELLVFPKHPKARVELLKQYDESNHPLKDCIEPLVKLWKLEGKRHG